MIWNVKFGFFSTCVFLFWFLFQVLISLICLFNHYRSPYASVESVKAASDVYAPVSGKVTSVNTQVTENPGSVNTGAETDAWFVKIEPSDAATETKTLMNSSAYKKHCAENAH